MPPLNRHRILNSGETIYLRKIRPEKDDYKFYDMGRGISRPGIPYPVKERRTYYGLKWLDILPQRHKIEWTTYACAWRGINLGAESIETLRIGYRYDVETDRQGYLYHTTIKHRRHGTKLYDNTSRYIRPRSIAYTDLVY